MRFIFEFFFELIVAFVYGSRTSLTNMWHTFCERTQRSGMEGQPNNGHSMCVCVTVLRVQTCPVLEPEEHQRMNHTCLIWQLVSLKKNTVRNIYRTISCFCGPNALCLGCSLRDRDELLGGEVAAQDPTDPPQHVRRQKRGRRQGGVWMLEV